MGRAGRRGARLRLTSGAHVAPAARASAAKMCAVPADPAPSTGASGRPHPSGGWPLAVWFVVLALLPLTASALHVAPGWLPVGDDATIEMRGRDLFTADMPLLGMPSAVGEQTGRPVHHPGPLELWWVGAWVRALGLAQASLLAAAAAWAAATTATLLLARRVGGTALLALSAVLVALLTWSLRGEVPVTPFNVHAIVVPLAAYLLALVAWHQRVPWAGIAALVLGSWAAQAHLTAVGPVVAAGLVVVGAVGLQSRRSPAARRWSARRLATGAAVLALCWLGPVVDVVTDGGGNVRAVLGARADLASEAIGLGTAADIVVRAVGWRPVWAQAGAHPSELVVAAGPGHWASAGAVVLVAVFGAVRQRRTHPALGVTVAATGTAIVVGAVLAARFPGEYLSLLALHNHLWLWPLATLLWGAALVAVGLEARDVVGPHLPRPARDAAVVVASLALLAVGIASVGEPHRNLTLAAPTYVRSLGDGVLDDVDPDGTYLVTISGDFDAFFLEVGLLAHLEDAGLDVVGPASYRRAFGDRRTTAGKPLDGELVVDVGWAADVADGPGLLVGEHRPSAELLAVRGEVEDRLVELVRSHPQELPLYGMDGDDDAELRRYLREDLDGFLLARLVPDWLPGAPETEAYLDLWRQPVLHATVHLVPATD